MMETVLVGGGGHARSVADAILRAGGRVVAVVDPHAVAIEWGVPVVASAAELDSPAAEVAHVVCVGHAGLRDRLTAELESLGRPIGTVLAVTATVGGLVGAGSQVLEHAHVGPGARIGRGVIVNTGAIVEHDCQIGDFAHIAPGARVLGAATVGAASMIGAGAVVLPGIRVGSGVVIGAGSVVVKDIAAGQQARGVPARVIES